METQDPFFGPTDRSSYEPFFDRSFLSPGIPFLTPPITKTAVERLAENILSRPSATSDELLQTADAVREIILEAPSNTDCRWLRFLVGRLQLRAEIEARLPRGKAEAAALLRVCPATASALRMWRASMPVSCSAWGWDAILGALIAAAEAMEIDGAGAG